MANVPTVSWDETSPAGSSKLNLGDDRIREFKTQVREVVDVDHDFPNSGQASDIGQHKQVTLQEQADLGTGAVSATILGSQTVAGKGELIYSDEDDNDIQMTSGGSLGAASQDLLCNTFNATTSISIAGVNILNMIYPVGSIYTNATNSTNPGTLLGFGTWSAFGAGKVIVGLNSGDSDFDTAEETGGAKTHTLIVGEMPAHTHNILGGNDSTDNSRPTLTGPNESWTEATQSAGGDGAHNNLQPYIVCYLWKRTA